VIHYMASRPDDVITLVAVVLSDTKNTISIIIEYFSHILSVILILAACVLVGINEELLFRGFLLEKLRSLCGDRIALILSSVAFILAHVPKYGFVRSFEVVGTSAFIFGLLYLWQNSIWPSVICHTLLDAFSFFMHLSQYDRSGRRILASITDQILKIPPVTTKNTHTLLSPHLSDFSVDYGRVTLTVRPHMVALVGYAINLIIILILYLIAFKRKKSNNSSVTQNIS
jgi:hypothetical protein